jgi:hypothetical protein
MPEQRIPDGACKTCCCRTAQRCVAMLATNTPNVPWPAWAEDETFARWDGLRPISSRPCPRHRPIPAQEPE